MAPNQWSGDLHEVGPYDGFVYAFGGVRVDTLNAPLKARRIGAQPIGDAFSPRSTMSAGIVDHNWSAAIAAAR